MVNTDTYLRTLAKSSYWQSLYKASQKCANISLFNNREDFSALQVRFLYWLEVYSLLYEELSTFVDDRLTEKVIANDFRTDAYLAYRNKKYEFLWRKHRQEEKEARLKSRRKKGFTHPGKESLIEVNLRREK